MQIDTFEDGTIFDIREHHVLKGNISSQFLWAVVGNVALHHFRRLTKYLLDAFSGRCAIARKVSQL